MVSQAISGFGTQLKVGDGATPEVFATVAEIHDVQLPQLSADTDEVTNMSSAGGWEEFISTIKRSGEVTFDINWIPTDPTHDEATGLAGMIGETKNFKVVLPDTGATTPTFTAIVTAFGPSAPMTGHLTASVTLKVTGQPLFNAA